ncbi:MAG TPA: spermidine/putrescine ABC transporter substrate-binding protein [Anaerolineae bacterium]|nr:spermidine/putrescine ABC transporter substrate-binding protein [Anaerolineae bacterium]
MNQKECHREPIGLLAVVALALFLAACSAPAATPTPIEPTTPAILEESTVPPPSATLTAQTPFVSQSSGQQTASGFECPEPQPKISVTSRELNLFVWTEYVPQDMLDCFELVYGIKINRSEYSSNEEMYAKLVQGSSQFDLAQPSDYIIAVMVRTGILDKLDRSRLPNLKNIAPAFAHVPGDPHGEYIVPYQAGTESLVYNADTIKTPPRAWKDLWNAEYADRMVFVDDPRYVIGAVLLAEGKDPNTTNPADLAAIKPKLAELIAHVKLFDSDSPKSALIAGDADLGYVYNGEAFLAAQENPAFKYVYPSEGTFLWQDGFGLVKEAPHPDAAYAWLNYMLQPDVFWLMLRDFPYTNPNQAALEYARNAAFKVKNSDGVEVSPAELYEAYLKSNITNPPAEVWQNGINIKDVGDALPLYDQLWTEVKSGH